MGEPIKEKKKKKSKDKTLGDLQVQLVFSWILLNSVVDPDPYVYEPPKSGSIIIYTYPHPSIIKQN